ncbi:YbaY family lipoprotein [Pantoea sp. Cy-639]|jgi:uncharacterized lipoprotein YbaY|uniref:YbaY family lipoprotein n=1 Tax=Pantoea sp. Cy-639 TaxID=2608360 RepID=UPI001423E771|nr:YbaY family lipoprotein [Pantoea sp. Cy-639]NIF16206.1 hypothetical protein [Pantoea sp. Cy-639]
MTDTTQIALNIVYSIGQAEQPAGMTVTLTDITHADKAKTVFATGANSAPSSPCAYTFNIDKSTIVFGNQYQVTVNVKTDAGTQYQDTRTFSLVADNDAHVFGLKLSRQ